MHRIWRIHTSTSHSGKISWTEREEEGNRKRTNRRDKGWKGKAYKREEDKEGKTTGWDNGGWSAFWDTGELGVGEITRLRYNSNW